MELRVLQFFDWNISLPTAAHFFEYFLVDCVTADDYFEGRILGSQATTAIATMSKYVVYFLEISLQGLCANMSFSVPDRIGQTHTAKCTLR